MKKNYSNPKFKIVLLDSNDIVCASDSIDVADQDISGVNAGAKRRDNNIWGDD